MKGVTAMSKLDKYRGIIPAFYACYDEEGNVSGERCTGPHTAFY